MKPWKRVEPTEVHKIGRRTVVTKHFEIPDGRLESFDSFGPENQHAAAVIALTTDGRVITVRQFRFGPEKIMDELPGGWVEPGEDPSVAVARELLEETGYRIGKLETLGTTCKDAYMNGTWHYFWATDCVFVQEQQLDEHEFIEVALITVRELIQKATAGLVSDAVAVLLAYEKLKQLQEG